MRAPPPNTITIGRRDFSAGEDFEKLAGLSSDLKGRLLMMLNDHLETGKIFAPLPHEIRRSALLGEAQRQVHSRGKLLIREKG